MHEYSQLDPTVVQGSLEVGLTILVYDTNRLISQRGDHDIENELIFRSNRHFVFHDSRGFETGSVSELELMKKFIADRAMKKQLAQRVHAIW